MLNRVVLAGRVSEYGAKISWTEQGKPQTSFTLIYEKEGGFKTFVPILVVGAKSETLAEMLEPHEFVLLEGSLSYRKGRTKDAGRLEVVCFDVGRLAGATAPAVPSVSHN
jgi:Single-strand binding protein family